MQGPVLFDFAADRLGGASAFAALMAALGLGALIGSFLIARFQNSTSSIPRALMIILAIDALALFSFTYGHTVWLCAIFMVVMGLISAGFAVLVRSYLQTTAPMKMRGRIIGLFEGLYGPLTIASLAILFGLATVMASPSILRTLAVLELAAALVGLAILAASGRRGTTVVEREAAADG